MVRCGVSEEIYCEYRRNGNCENAQDPCPCDKKETIKTIKRHLKGIEKAVENLEREE